MNHLRYAGTPLSEVIPPTHEMAEGDVLQQGNPPDTDWVKFVKVRSELLSEFWGRDMYIGANVLLPAGYETSGRDYPVLYMQGHFPGGRAPLGFVEDAPGRGRGEGFADDWQSGRAPGMIAVSFRDANPYYDTSYSVNSENLGPYGDAITEELIPYLESQFRMLGFGPIRTAWLAQAARLGEAITARTMRETWQGTFEDVDAEGHLVLRGPRGVRRIAAADIYF